MNLKSRTKSAHTSAMPHLCPSRTLLLATLSFNVAGWMNPAHAIGEKAPQVVSLSKIGTAVSLPVTVDDGGVIEGKTVNNTGKKIGDVEVLVEYAWIWAEDFSRDRDDDSGWSITYTLPVELIPGGSVPVKIAPLHELSKRDGGHYLISAKVVGYTRYRWVTPHDQ